LEKQAQTHSFAMAPKQIQRDPGTGHKHRGNQETQAQEAQQHGKAAP